MMASAFDSVDEFTAKSIKRCLWAGESCAAIGREWGIAAKVIARMRDDLFAPFASPEAVKEAARGPVINPLALNRPKSRRRSTAPKAVQIEMFQP